MKTQEKETPPLNGSGDVEKKEVKEVDLVDKKHEPAEGSPRWKEVYRGWKDEERKRQELEKDLDAMRKHSRDMAERLEKIEVTKADRPKIQAPNPAEDFDGWKTWYENEKVQLEKSVFENTEKTRHENMLMMMNALYDDYEENAAVAERDIEKDEALKKEIYSKPNPYKAAYEYGKKKKNPPKDARIPPHIEESGDMPPNEEEEEELSNDEMRVARNMWPGMPVEEMKKKYLTHKKALGINRRGGR